MATENIAHQGRKRDCQSWWTRSLSLVPPLAIVPFHHLLVVWATILGFAIWGDMATPELLHGSSIIVASGLDTLGARRCGTQARRPAAQYRPGPSSAAIARWVPASAHCALVPPGPQQVGWR